MLNISLKTRLWLTYFSGFLLAIHYASVTYVNSSLLKQFVGDSLLNIFYVIGSILSLVFLSLAPFILRKYGSVLTFIFFITLEALAVFGMGSGSIAFLIIILFFVHLGADSMLYFCMDLNLEQETRAEGTTGEKRGVFLTFSNIAWVLAPLALASLVTVGDFRDIYFFSGLALLPIILIVVLFFQNTKQIETATANIWPALRSLKRTGDNARIIGVQFMLNFFYAWMVIYLPLLLNQEIGFGWDKIGVMFTIMLLPFLLFELPAGLLSDKKIGEKELIITGFIIMFLATLTIPFIKTQIFWLWAAILFISRIGASLVEVSSESYFFKHVKEGDTGLISLFRMARPLALIIAPLIAIPVMFFFSYSTSFYFLAFLTLSGLFFIPKVDTR